MSVDGRSWSWYELTRLQLPGKIDLLIVDGPPAGIGLNARYPAIPLLYEHLNSAAQIFVDDGDRPDETETAERWRKQFTDLMVESLPTEKGTFLLRRTARPSKSATLAE
jgi:hypothetical protein